VIPLVKVLLVAAVMSVGANAQSTWHALPQLSNSGAWAYDTWRDRLVSVGNGSIDEFDGTAWVQVLGSAPAAYWLSWVAFDEARGRTVFCGFSTSTSPAPEMWEWDGHLSTLTFAGYGPFFAGDVHHVTYVSSLGSLVMVSAVVGVQGLALYSWNGVYFTLLPAGVPPPTRPQFGNNHYEYHGITCDRTTGKLVMFGRTEYTPVPSVASTAAVTWEWDAATGWTDLGTSGTVANWSTVWFDAHRGRVMRLDEGPGQNLFVRSAGNSWSAFPLQGSHVQMGWVDAYDELRNRVYGHNQDPAAPGPGYITDVFPSIYEHHRTGCLIFGMPTLWLAQPASRAWLGSTLVVEIGGITGPIAFLAMGLSDQAYGGTPLPISLASIGMPTCFLNVEPQVTVAAIPSGGVASVSLAIPNSPQLIGTSLFHQAFSFVSGANPLNLLASDSMRATIGQWQ
jgi:hypothetical protein